MSYTNFTKGPWKLHDKDEMEVESVDGIGVCNVYSEDPDFTGFNVSRECAANAYLIAAAPEMYAELEFIRHYIQGNRALEFQNRIDNLLAKARGEHER